MNREQPVMDPGKIEEFRTYSDGTDDFIIKLFDTYIENSKSLIANIKNSHKEKNPDQLLMDIHTLKGSSGNMGLTRIGDFITDWEAAVKEKGIENHDKELTRLQELFEEARKFYQKNFPH